MSEHRGDHSQIWTYRLPSLLGGIAAVWLTFWCARGCSAPRPACWRRCLLGFTLLLTAEATIATTDAVLLAAILGAQGVLLRVYRAARDEGGRRLDPAGAVGLGGARASASGQGPVVARRVARS